MQLHVQIKLAFATESVAKAVYQALKPDNVGFPAGLKMEMKKSTGSLILAFSSEVPLGTITSTIDEILEKIQITNDLLSDGIDLPR